MRKLATIQTVKEVLPIAGKDRIKYISFVNTGWHVIADSSIKVGDKVMYFEADSVLPVEERFEFLRKRCFHSKYCGFFIRNMKMCGLYSEGLVLTLDNFPSDYRNSSDGEDFTKILKVMHYEDCGEDATKVPQLVRGNKYLWKLKQFFLKFVPKKNYAWPSFVSKTDETRAQVLNYIYEKYDGLDVIACEKLDGQSLTLAVKGKRVYLCSRNVNLPLKAKMPNNHQQFFMLNNLEKVLLKVRKQCGYDFYLQGELMGPNIQGNKCFFRERRLFIFNVKNLSKDKYMSYAEMVNFYSRITEYMPLDAYIYVVPKIKTFKFNFKTIQELQDFSKGNSLYYPTPREGLVIRSVEPMPADTNQSNMLSFKIINPDFDLLHNK